MKSTRHTWQYFSLLMLVWTLSGCLENRNTSHLCTNHPQICEGLNINDGQCNQLRTHLIWLRYDQLENPSEFKKFDELALTKEYAKCMHLAGQIEVTTLDSKKTLRIEALHQAQKAVEQIEQELETSHQPSIIYHRWTQGDVSALEKFLALEKTEHLDTPELQYGLATYYIKRDRPHAIFILKKGLTFYDGRDGRTLTETLPKILQSLATTTHAENLLDEAYFWAMVGDHFSVPIVNEKRLNLLYPMTEKNDAI